MPTLEWIGKKAVLNHHNEIPFRLLKSVPELSVGDPGHAARPAIHVVFHDSGVLSSNFIRNQHVI
jgi:hypothetical protein